MGVPQRHSGIRRPGRGLKGVQSVGVGGEGGVLGFQFGSLRGSDLRGPRKKHLLTKSGGSNLGGRCLMRKNFVKRPDQGLLTKFFVHKAPPQI